MPSRNIVRSDKAESYYHVYSRGSSKQAIFLDAADYLYFTKLFERYLSPKATINKNGEPYPKYNGKAELLAYCLMPNHYHLLFYQIDLGAVAGCMKSINTSYTRYFNLRHKRSGPLFESRFKAALVNKDDYLDHVSRYIHLNPRSWRRYPYSSYCYYLDGNEPNWLQTGRVLETHGHNREAYQTFTQDYESSKAMLDELKHELADK